MKRDPFALDFPDPQPLPARPEGAATRQGWSFRVVGLKVVVDRTLVDGSSTRYFRGPTGETMRRGVDYSQRMQYESRRLAAQAGAWALRRVFEAQMASAVRSARASSDAALGA
jgi:hypothetical protein